MGVFDYIRCELPLPGNPAPKVMDNLQTKSFPERSMRDLEIRQDGRLYIHEKVRNKGVETGTRISELRVNGRPFHGMLEMHTGEFNANGLLTWWWSWEVEFTRGKVSWIFEGERCGRRDSE